MSDELVSHHLTQLEKLLTEFINTEDQNCGEKLDRFVNFLLKHDDVSVADVLEVMEKPLENLEDDVPQKDVA